MATKRTDHNFWAVLRPAGDMPGVWTAHCLDVDVISYGNTIEEAYGSLAESVLLVLRMDTQRGLDPLQRKAPDEFWDQLWRMLDDSRPVKFETLREKAGQGKISWAITSLPFVHVCEDDNEEDEAKAPPRLWAEHESTCQATA